MRPIILTGHAEGVDIILHAFYHFAYSLGQSHCSSIQIGFAGPLSQSGSQCFIPRQDHQNPLEIRTSHPSQQVYNVLRIFELVQERCTADKVP